MVTRLASDIRKKANISVKQSPEAILHIAVNSFSSKDLQISAKFGTVIHSKKSK